MKNVKSSIQKRKKNNRKGVIDVQFNWIFVMIAGFVIFLFIISVVFAQKRNADTQAGISAINQVTALLKSKQQTPNVYSEITLPRMNINFRCEEAAKNTYYFTFKIENAERKQLPTEILFAPQELTTNKILVWSQAFNLGFPVSVFTYITTADSTLLIYDPTYNPTTSGNSYASQIFDDLPSNITKKIVKDATEIETYKDYARTKIICFEDIGCPLPTQYDYINIIPAQEVELYDYGNVTFHKKSPTNAPDKPQQTIQYITKSGLYGAIFSDTPEYYNCQMSRALEQFEVKRSLVESRLTLIQDALPENECKNTIKAVLNIEIDRMRNPYLNEDNMTSLNQNTKYLDIQNTNLILDSCPKIY
jgi:hypothetical protein